MERRETFRKLRMRENFSKAFEGYFQWISKAGEGLDSGRNGFGFTNSSPYFPIVFQYNSSPTQPPHNSASLVLFETYNNTYSSIFIRLPKKIDSVHIYSIVIKRTCQSKKIKYFSNDTQTPYTFNVPL